MSFAIIPAAEVPLDQQAAIANRAFAGYVAGWAELDAAGLARFLCLQGADLFYSRFVRVDESLAGFGYINRTGNIPRLAGMALEPSARGTGAAGYLLQHLCEEARERREPAMVLEVIEQNARAHAFYKRENFRNLGRLSGWRLTSAETVESPLSKLEGLPILEAMKSPAKCEYPERPWQISRFAAAKYPGACAYRHRDTVIVLIDPDLVGPIRIHSLFSATGDWGEQRDALAAVLCKFPGRELFAAPVFPEDFGVEVFAPLGFAREKLSQFLMRRDFGKPSSA